MSKNRQTLGAWGEQVALDHLLEQGDRLLARNVRTPYGELDLVTQRRETTVFTEVKTRRSDAYGFPEESVTLAKQQHLISSALAFLDRYPEHDGDWQIDVIAIRQSGSRTPEIVHFENAVTG